MRLLADLYKIHSPSGLENVMRNYILQWVEINSPAAKVVVDKVGNILITKGFAQSYPCVVAHIDQVQRLHSEDFTACYSKHSDTIFGFSPSNKDYEGLGADDKNGVWIALEALVRFNEIKVALFVGEEIGCIGSRAVDMLWFNDCRWVIQPDRRGGSDLITCASNVDLCSDKFIDDLHAERFGYSENHGIMTDVLELKENGLKVSCINLSCGYYNPHTDYEFTILTELLNARDFVFWAVENLTNVYPHEHIPYNYWGGYYTTKDSAYDDYFIEEYIFGLMLEEPMLSDKEILLRVKDNYPNLSKTKIKKMIKKTKTWL